MRWLGACGMVVVLVGACTRLNAGFEDGEASTADEQGEVGQEGEGTTTAGGGTTRGSADTTDSSDTRATTSEVETTVGVTSDATLGSSSDASDSSESGTTKSCPPFPDAFEIDVMPPLIALPFFECQFGPTIRDYTFTLDDQIDPTTVSAQLCSDMCFCEGPIVQMTFDAPLPPLPPSGDCFGLLVEFSPNDQKTCFVSAYLVQGEGVLLTMASNRLIPEALGLPVEVTLGDLVEGCEGCEKPASGSHALESLGVSIPPGATGDAGGFAIHNAGAVVDESCNQVVRWSAMEMPG